MKDKRKQAIILTAIMTVGLGIFELINFNGSVRGFDLLWDRKSWSYLLAFCFAAVDFAGLGRLAQRDIGKMEQLVIWMLGGAWVLSAMFDTFLSYLTIANAMAGQAAGNILVQTGHISAKTFTVYAPIGAAFLMWLVQVLLVWYMNKGVGEIVRSSAPPQSRGGGEQRRRQLEEEYRQGNMF